MKRQRVTAVLTIINLILLVFQLSNGRRVQAQADGHILRGQGLEIVDSAGRVRASISIEPPVTVDSQSYPETVLLRLTDPVNGPVVKLTASKEGSTLGLSDDVDGGVVISATDRKGNFLKVTSREGREETIQP